MLRLLSLLQTHRYWPGSELAERLGVSERTLRRDVDRLRELGYPVESTRGVAGGYQLRSGAAMPPLLLDDEEAVAIAVGLRTAAQGAVEGIEETSVRALAKVVQVMPPRLRNRVEALCSSTSPATPGGGPTVDAVTLTVIAQACRDTEMLRFAYTSRDGEETRRLVEPHRLVPLWHRWYLVAWDVGRNDWRTFRVDRVREPRATGARFAPREIPGGDAAEFVRRRHRSLPKRYRVVAEVHADAADVRRTAASWGTVEELGGGVCRLTVHADTFDWPTLLLVSLGAEFHVVDPPEFRSYLRERAEQFLRATGPGGPGQGAGDRS
ncbi:transcriptional regulator [Thermobifida cellulosilytica TB100]|uniref:Transcriptional regulator n=2 Tax=Thermobifida cellulosilytica TaxID=144786 RepID=A0A147KJ82_THECS|nr:transcriptional regulator [Thermobifida cellulosilytica TB100]